jgi:hypothetical protein
MNNNIRGLLENIIDESIHIMPALMNLFRNNVPPEFGIQRLEDYAFGYIQGMILGQFISSYRAIFAQNLPQEVAADAGRILLRRSRDIREAIFRVG